MNYAIVFRLLGYVLMIEGALLLLPAAASGFYGEWFVLGVFLITAAVSAAIGYALRGIKPQSKVFYMRDNKNRLLIIFFILYFRRKSLNLFYDYLSSIYHTL